MKDVLIELDEAIESVIEMAERANIRELDKRTYILEQVWEKVRTLLLGEDE